MANAVTRSARLTRKLFLATVVAALVHGAAAQARVVDIDVAPVEKNVRAAVTGALVGRADPARLEHVRMPTPGTAMPGSPAQPLAATGAPFAGQVERYGDDVPASGSRAESITHSAAHEERESGLWVIFLFGLVLFVFQLRRKSRRDAVRILAR